MRRLYRQFKTSCVALWKGVREWSGDAAYERYLECLTRKGSAAPLSRERFYVEQMNRKYSRPNRCC